jgi:hypothetical protein
MIRSPGGKPVTFRGRKAAVLGLLWLTAACATLPSPAVPGGAAPPPCPPGPEGYALTGDSVAPGAQYYVLQQARASSLLPFALRRVRSCDYLGAAGALRVEDLVFSSPQDAFGARNALLRPDPDGGAASVLPPESLFQQERHLVRILAPDGRDLPVPLVEEVAGRVAATLPDASSPPPEAAVIIARGVPDREIRYETIAVLGERVLAPAMVATLPSPPGGKPLLLLVGRREGEEEAVRDMEVLIASRGSGRKGVSFTVGVGETAVTVWDQEWGWVNVARQGSILVGLGGMAKPGDGWPLVAVILAELRGTP